MKMNLRTFTWLGLAVFAFGLTACERTGADPGIACSKLNDTAAPHPEAAQYEALLQKYIRLGLPGIAVRVEDGRGIYTGAAGLADIRGGINFTPCTVSKLGSVTKPFLATSVFRLAEQGLLDLEAPVAAYFTADQRKRVANLELVSLRDLLMHRTGIPDLIAQSTYYL
ncbi:MAG: serine hydrolase domain-containing protein, partial [Bacteroidia bacterium]